MKTADKPARRPRRSRPTLSQRRRQEARRSLPAAPVVWTAPDADDATDTPTAS